MERKQHLPIVIRFRPTLAHVHMTMMLLWSADKVSQTIIVSCVDLKSHFLVRFELSIILDNSTRMHYVPIHFECLCSQMNVMNCTPSASYTEHASVHNANLHCV